MKNSQGRVSLCGGILATMRRNLLVKSNVFGLLLVFLVLTGLFAWQGEAKAATYVSGSITQDTTWTVADSPYVINGRLTVSQGVTLIVDPGVIVKFNWDTVGTNQIIVSGTLVADGTPSEPIYFTSFKDDSVGGDTNGDSSASSPSRGDWYRLYFSSTSTGNLLDNVVVRYAGTGLYIDEAMSLTVSNSTIQHNSGTGIYVRNTSPTISGNVIRGNSTYGVLNATSSITVNAENNYRGDASGPYDPSDDTATGGLYNPSGQGDRISDYVDYEPWLGHDPNPHVLRVTYPNGEDVLNKGQYYSITWNNNDVTGNIQIDLYKGGTEPENMFLQLAAETENDSEYPFKPPQYFASGDDYFIGISAEDGTIWDFSDSSFTIQNIEQSLPDHFSFSSISFPQNVDIPFSVTITAIDDLGSTTTRFNGNVSLSCNGISISPTNVTLDNGQATVMVTLYNQGNAQLNCNAYGISGISNGFTVGGAAPCEGSVAGKVVDSNGDEVWQAVVSLYDPQDQQVGNNYFTDTDGIFQITNLDCNTYKIHVEKDDAEKEKTIDVVWNLPNIIPDIALLDLNAGTNGTPVILVPGIMGSSSDYISPYPKLSSTIPDPYLHIHDPLGQVGFNLLRQRLKDADFNVSGCPWDWRFKADAAYKRIHSDEIDLVKAIYSTTGKVHIVAHSMGGLVVRASPFKVVIDYFLLLAISRAVET